MSENHVAVKLDSGELFMAVLHQEEDSFYIFKNPIQFRTMPMITEQGLKETPTTTPLCMISSAELFNIDKIHVVYVVELNKAFVNTYTKLVEAYKEEMEFNNAEEDKEIILETLSEEDKKNVIRFPPPKEIH
jgi:hypothetical protein